MTSSYIGKVLDNYRIIENIGIGGMGVVFKAIHIKLDKIFALKMIAPGLMMNDNFIKRFQTEAKALAKFEDPNIVRVYDLRSDNDQWFIVMEYVEGVNLSDKIKKDGIYHWEKALPILKQILTAIDHAHDSGVIHRDIKPNNIMINDKNMVKITDFGLAKDQTNLNTTMSVSSGGTLYYMSPEHLRGFSFTDNRSDIYSIGITLFEMLTGHVPFINLESDYDIRESIVRKKYKKPREFDPEIPLELEEIIMKSIAKNPDERYQHIDEMLEAIRDFESDYSVQDVAMEVLHKKKKTSRKTGVQRTFGRILGNNYLRKYGWIAGIAAIILTIFLLTDLFKTQAEEKRPSGLPHISILAQYGPAMVFLNGDSLGYTPIYKHGVQPGNYALQLHRENFDPIDTMIVVSAANKLNLSFALQKIEMPALSVAPSSFSEKVETESKTVVSQPSVRIASNPPGAEFWMDGQLYGNTPLTVTQVDPGEHRIELRKEGYLTHNDQIFLKNGKNPAISPVLTALTGRLLIATEPPLATVWLNGEELTENNTPIDITDIPVGQYQVEVKKAGFAPITKEIEIRKGNTEKINVELVRLEGKLSVQIRPWGSIYINDQLVKESADIKYQVTLPVDDYVLKVVHPTLGYWLKTIRLNEKDLTEIVVNFNHKIDLEIDAVDENGNPLDGEIYIDDEKTGYSAPGKINLRVGVHRLMVKKTGYLTTQGEKVLLVDQNLTEKQKFVLKKLE